jgi:hypothetical protein
MKDKGRCFQVQYVPTLPWVVVGPKILLNWKILRVVCALNGSQTIIEPSFPICSIEEIDSELSGLIRQTTRIFPVKELLEIIETVNINEKAELY